LGLVDVQCQILEGAILVPYIVLSESIRCLVNLMWQLRHAW